MYNIKIEKFEGPLDLLLQLIERDEMDISEISLASIADEFIEYIAAGKGIIKHEFGIMNGDGIMNHESGIMNREEGGEYDEIEFAHGKIPPSPPLGKGGINCADANELSDFLVIAAKLLYIKSKYLMPFLAHDDEEEDIGDLENRLKIYKEFLDASKKIEKFYEDKKRSYLREKNLVNLIKTPLTPLWKMGELNSFFPPEKLGKEDLKNCFEEIIGNLKSPFALEQENIERTITVQEKIEQIRALILKRANLNFTKMIHKADKKDIIVSFLSILELVKEQFIVVEQEGYFSEIIIRKY